MICRNDVILGDGVISFKVLEIHWWAQLLSIDGLDIKCNACTCMYATGSEDQQMTVIMKYRWHD